MPYTPPSLAKSLTSLASPLPNTKNPPVVRASYGPAVPAGLESVASVPADVFASWNGVRSAILIHCPAGLNRAIRNAHAIRGLF
jgi:hypothetical protein